MSSTQKQNTPNTEGKNHTTQPYNFSNDRKVAIILNFSTEYEKENLFKPLNDVCCFDFDGTLTTHTGNECTKDSNFSLKPNALTELLTVAKKGLFFIVSNNQNELRKYVTEKFTKFSDPEKKELSSEDLQLILKNMVFVQQEKSLESSTMDNKNNLIQAVFDNFGKPGEMVTVTYTDDNLEYVQEAQNEFSTKKDMTIYVLHQKQGNEPFVMPDENNQHTKEALEEIQHAAKEAEKAKITKLPKFNFNENLNKSFLARRSKLSTKNSENPQNSENDKNLTDSLLDAQNLYLKQTKKQTSPSPSRSRSPSPKQ